MVPINPCAEEKEDIYLLTMHIQLSKPNSV